tara:strand:- start:162 stop:326 length:165 start_codon:yes stop_codon:yes gene_type:complete
MNKLNRLKELHNILESQNWYWNESSKYDELRQIDNKIDELKELIEDVNVSMEDK